jgi:acetyl-CoA carboxylase biotin carboxylase subunit
MSHSKKLLHTRPFKRVLIANRGEIALRVIRSCRDLGLESVAVYSDADSESLHRYQADFAVRLPGNLSADTYLNMPALLSAIKKSGADAVHPGYGFLSENSAFARAVCDAGIVFIGPDPVAMEKMGNKIEARNLMMAGGVPVVPGAKEPLANLSALKAMAKEIGYPLILKAAGGGGGRGMRVVRADKELEAAFEGCKREAVAYFGNPDVFCERYIEFPRHIEFQVMFDSHGNGVHLFERDCSIQRRHQKLIEEAPSTFLNEKNRMEIGARAIAAARATGYIGAGTIEFICESPEKVYFMEMNTRIQVEHPVTEMITGIDLIATQITVAMGAPLPFKQEDLKINGWSFEARINTEDASRNFAPSPGTVTQLRLPSGPFVRVDSHLYPGYTIPEFYDSMVAKVITWGRNRDEAMARLARALGEMRIEGVPTTAPFHEALLADENFRAGKFTTRFIEENEQKLKDSMSQLSTEFPDLFATAGAVLNQSPPPAPAVSEERKEWLMTGRLQGMN